jgi:glycosyltransferase involved in cell wall biosynthesis
MLVAFERNTKKLYWSPLDPMIKRIFPEHNIKFANSTVFPHVLLVLDQFPESLGGGERVALKLAELLPQYGYRVSILTFGIHPKSNALRQAKCPIYLLPLQRVYDFNAIRASFALRDFLRSERVQIVQTFFESSDLWAGFVTKAMSDARLIWSRRDMGILRAPKHRLAYRLMARMPDAVFAVSDQVRRHCVEVDRIDPQRAFTIYNGIDLSIWPPVTRAAIHSKEITISTVGNIRRIKGHDVLVRAAARVVELHPQVQFKVAGDVLEPQYFAELLQLVGGLGLTSNFHFVGGKSDLTEFLIGTDIFVLPSRSEGFSNAVIEAMATSLPVVATDVGGNAEAVIDGVNGYIVGANDVDTLFQAIEKLIAEPTNAIAMGVAGRDLVIEKFTIDAMMTSVAARYRELLSPK